MVRLVSEVGGALSQRVVRIMLPVMVAVMALGLTARAQDWPICTPAICTSQNLKVMDARATNITACSGSLRTADIQIYFDVTGLTYNVRVHGTVKDSQDAVVATIDTCAASYSADGWVTLLSNVTWDCARSLEVIKLFVSWQNLAINYPCGSTLPCAAIDPMCDNTFYSSPIAVAGTEPPNTPPTGSNSSIATNEDTTYVFSVSDFGYNDDDGDPLSQIRITALESVGDLELSGSPVPLNQVVTAAQLDNESLTYDPLPGESATPYDTFRFEVHDGTEYSAADYQMTVNVNAVNDPPVANDDTAETTRGKAVLIAVLGNDSDPEGGALTLVSVTAPQDGRAELDGNEVRYSPSLFFIGADAFEYTVRDAQGLTASASVDVNVLDPNSPPVANADGAYLGMVGEPIMLDARFSSDPDAQDMLQYRWDLNQDGEWDTEWLTQPTYETVFTRPYRGLITLEVRDIYLGQPNGTSAQATAYAFIEPRPTQIAVSVYVDLNGNGEFDEEDVGLPGVSLLFDDELERLTEEDGTAILDDAAPGIHTIRISEEGIAYLQERGFFLSEEALASVELESGEWVALFFSPEARGFLEVDLGAEDDQNSEGND